MHKKIQLPIKNLWVFGYGSLMWDPGFSYLESMRAKISGFHRSLCIRSIRYRGTDENPGLVFGLERGGTCTGIAYLVATAKQQEVVDYLWAREMLHYVYEPTIEMIQLEDGRQVKAITFVVQQQHPSYIKELTNDQIAKIIAGAKGQRGTNLEYVLATISSLESIGIKDESLRLIGELARTNYDNNKVHGKLSHTVK